MCEEAQDVVRLSENGCLCNGWRIAGGARLLSVSSASYDGAARQSILIILVQRLEDEYSVRMETLFEIAEIIYLAEEESRMCVEPTPTLLYRIEHGERSGTGKDYENALRGRDRLCRAPVSLVRGDGLDLTQVRRLVRAVFQLTGSRKERQEKKKRRRRRKRTKKKRFV